MDRIREVEEGTNRQEMSGCYLKSKKKTWGENLKKKLKCRRARGRELAQDLQKRQGGGHSGLFSTTNKVGAIALGGRGVFPGWRAGVMSGLQKEGGTTLSASGGDGRRPIKNSGFKRGRKLKPGIPTRRNEEAEGGLWRGGARDRE